jgi:FAD/FMN-containing dehydrogenase
MIDKRPALIVQPRSSDEVAAAVRYARSQDLPIAVKGGGHSAPGHSVCDDGMMIDLSLMRGTWVDPVSRRAGAQGGCLLEDLDKETQKHGLAVPAGAISHTGVGGLVLGGGFGNIMRKHGLSIDSLIGAEVVLANGEVVQADAAQHPDLFWALRGGSGNFGIVTEFRFTCHQVGPLYVSAAVYELDHARAAMQAFRAEMESGAPDELQWICLFRGGAELPFVPSDLVHQPSFMMAMMWAGDPEEGRQYIDGLTSAIPDARVVVGSVQDYVDMQSTLDEVFKHGRRHYAKAGFLDALPDELLDNLIEHVRSLPSPFTQLEVLRLGGAVERVPVDATAFPFRQARWPVNIVGLWETGAEDDERQIAWVREAYRLMEPHMSGGVYVNYAGGDETGGTSSAYGRTWDRLAEVKLTYDPDNVFRFNQNITPRTAVGG